ncbi:MAG: hypothetical protein ACD_49C00023G0009 [uncultured bacterium (gcode 4)]|uniref:Uncharacterized protein n=1 Tax=uncultured bacterium (gcode 4) TaxID=1234023 RepID=K2AY45_9BACT|nr:MAG: hypothetical protein ACD_49C00023G0009 [uncultured bacterium (gcode 4)]
MVQTEQFSQLNILNNLEKKEFNFSQEDKIKIQQFWEKNTETFISVFDTLPKMASYKVDKEGILEKTFQNTTKLKNTFQV